MTTRGKSHFEVARDELMSHVMRCRVLDAGMEQREEWMQETIGYMGERYPDLSDIELRKLEIVGRQFIQPAIPFGSGHNAMTRGAGGDTAETVVPASDEVQAGEEEQELQPV